MYKFNKLYKHHDLASLPGDKEVKLQIFMGKFAKFKIYHVDYQRNLSLELKRKGFHA